MEKVVLRPLAIFIIALSGACSPSSASNIDAMRAEWRVTAVDDRTVMVQADFSDAEHATYEPPGPIRDPGDWRWNKRFRKAAADALSARPKIEAALTNAANWKTDGIPATTVGYWKSATGLTRHPDSTGKISISYSADVVYSLFISLPEKLADEKLLHITGPFGADLKFTRTPSSVSPFFKVNQVAYLPNASRKFVYLGGWLGTGGAWIPPPEATTFDVIDISDGSIALSGVLEPCNAEGQTPDATPWYGEKTLQADISRLTHEGTYFMRVPGIGRSQNFKVSRAAVRDAFAVQMHGLFIQRCGSSDKHAPYTHWPDRACHVTVTRGIFPPDILDYVGAPQKRTNFGFFDAAGNPANVTPFDVIALNAPKNGEPLAAPGGWHDAADYDRRPMHLNIVNDLAALYMLKRRHFSDYDLNLPESGNGIPDILDEAAWGLEHLRAVQQSDGGVGTWTETTGHPVEGMGMPSDDKSIYYVSRATRASTMNYCASAAMLARLHPALKERFLDSALKAWRYALNTPPAAKVPMLAKDKGKVVQLYWTEQTVLPPQDQLKAALNLSVITHDRSYLESTLTPEFGNTFTNIWRKDGFSWRPLRLVELEFEEDPRLHGFRHLMHDIARRGADRHVRSTEENRAYRTPWVAPWHNPPSNGMAWGNCHPMSAALWLIAAHAFTGERKYLDAAQLAYDFHCGCNPDGMTLTSGLGTIYPVSALHLQSSADSIAEIAAGITPYRWSGGHPGGAADIELVHTREEARLWPVWRQRPNLETLHVPSGEFTIWETIYPGAVVCGYLMDNANDHQPRMSPIAPPASSRKQLPGYWAIP